MINFLAFQVNGLLRFWLGWRPGGQLAPLEQPPLSVLAQDEGLLPAFVRACPVAMKYLRLLGPLDWAHFPERPANRPWPGPGPQARAPFVAAYLVKLHESKTYMSDLRQFLVEHPALVWLLGFKLKPDPSASHGFDPEASVPGRKQLGRVLRELDNAALQFLLDGTVQLIWDQLPPHLRFGDEISMDTKHLIAWVKENNPKAYVKESDRLDKTRQPAGDPDCKLGCKRKRNQGPEPQDPEPQPAKPKGKKGKRATNFSPLDEYYWGYASGIVATKVPGYGEFVLAELTQTFNGPTSATSTRCWPRSNAAWAARPALARSTPRLMPGTPLTTSLRRAVLPPCPSPAKGATPALTTPVCPCARPGCQHLHLRRCKCALSLDLYELPGSGPSASGSLRLPAAGS
jgi:hypothetical protein